MAISFQRIKKWTMMLLGKSPYHVHQDEGKLYSLKCIKGYYNNLTEKVTRFGYEDDRLPLVTTDSGKNIYFSIAIFQYGLGAYDLYLQNRDENMLKKAIACANWALAQQNENGSWTTFAHEKPVHPYSSMAQGEGISLLCRAYLETNDARYLDAAKKAVTFMLTDIKDGGTTSYAEGQTIFCEYTDKPPVLNGWIFSLWGVWDYCKMFPEDGEIKGKMEASLQTMKEMLPEYDNGYWSLYHLGGWIASPFYHSLHIAQLRVLADMFQAPIFAEYAARWEMYRSKPQNTARAFICKATQKLLER